MARNRDGDHPDLGKLQILSKAMEKRHGRLPSVRKDSWQWGQWRQWYKERGIPTTWSDKQADDYFFTVPMETPPVDLDGALEAVTSKGGGVKLKV